MGKIKIRKLDTDDASKKKKKKGAKLGTADMIRQRRKTIHKPKVNPFDYKFSKKRINVVGQASVKGSRGAPAASRVKAFKKREATILKEYRGLNRSGRHEDNRIKSARKVKRSIYNLDDNAEGFLDIKKPQTVFAAQRLDDSESEDDLDQAMNDSVLEQMNFGGGFLTKKVSEGPERSKAEMFSEMIAETKKRRFERQAEKDETHLLSEKLQAEWKGGIEREVARGLEKEPRPEDSTIDEFARLIKEVKFDIPIPLPPEQPQEQTKTLKMAQENRKTNSTPSASILKTLAEPASKKKKGVQFMMPRLEEDLTLKKRNKTTKSTETMSAKRLNDLHRLKQKTRKEKNSAIRELRRDREFLAKVQLDDQLAADEERKRKVNKLMNDLEMQEHEFKQFSKPVKP